MLLNATGYNIWNYRETLVFDWKKHSVVNAVLGNPIINNLHNLLSYN